MRHKKVESSKVRKGLIAILGGLVVFVGIIAIPYPGPGWLIVFAGLGILGTEFPWAKRILDRLKVYYDAWQKWYERQSIVVRLMFASFTLVLVIVTIWLLNGYGLLDDFLGLNIEWLHSPLPIFR